MKSLALAVVVALSTIATGAIAAPAVPPLSPCTACSAVMTTAANPTEMTPEASLQRASRRED